jgi:hypothetical protein
MDAVPIELIEVAEIYEDTLITTAIIVDCKACILKPN